MAATVGVLVLHLHMPGIRSLKEKRSAIRPLIHRLHREFNLSVAEVDLLQRTDEAVIACAHVSNDRSFTHRTLQKVAQWIERHWDQGYIADETLEIW